MEVKTRRTSRDRFRLDYSRKATTQSGKEWIVHARRQIDAETTDPLAVPLPWFIILPWAAIRESRNVGKYERRWVVEIYPPWEHSKAKIVGSGTKAEALDLVDTEVQRLVAGS